jgi:glutamate synthase domain-containing protein 2
MLRTGKSADLLEYSYTKNDFIASREHTSQIVNDVLGSSFTNTFSNSKEGVFRKLDSNINIRNTFKLKYNNSISIDEVESVDEIVKRFKTGAMSYGSISKEAHDVNQGLMEDSSSAQ